MNLKIYGIGVFIWNIFLLLRLAKQIIIIKNKYAHGPSYMLMYHIGISLLWHIPYKCSYIFNNIQFFFRCTNSILLWWLYIFIQVLWLFSEIKSSEQWALIINEVEVSCMGVEKEINPTKSSTVLYILECLLYLCVSTRTFRLYRINQRNKVNSLLCSIYC